LTKGQYEEHITSHYKRLRGFDARRRNKVYKQLIDEQYQIPEVRTPHEQLIEAEKKEEELVDSIELSRKELRAISAEKKRLESETITEKKRLEKEKKNAAKAFKKAKTAKKKKVEPVVKDSPSRKVRKIRIPLDETPISGIPERASESFDFEDDAMASPKTAIDDLFDRLSNEKVNR
jgi:hypothetical protein